MKQGYFCQYSYQLLMCCLHLNYCASLSCCLPANLVENVAKEFLRRPDSLNTSEEETL